MRGIRDDEESFEQGGGLVGVDLVESVKGVRTGGQGIVPDNVIGERLHDGGFEGGGGLFTESCGHGISEGGEMWRGVMGDGMEEGIIEVGEKEFLLENVCWVFEEENRRKAVLEVCKVEN